MVVQPSTGLHFYCALGAGKMIIHSKRLIFVHVQKTGGNSIASALGEHPDCPEKHFLARDLRECYGINVWKDHFKFAFVRNPWDRLVSWWSMINGHRKIYDSGIPLNKFHSLVLSRSTTFEEFLDCDEEIVDIDGPKWIYRNQIDYLTDISGRLIVDFVGRFESIQQDFEAVTKKALGQSYTLPHLNGSTHHHYSEYYNCSRAKKVEARFARDIAAFGYTFEK
jgi:Sulfotransferase family